MDLNLTPNERQFRDELRTWLDANRPQPWPDPKTATATNADYTQHLRDWQRTLFEGGWIGIGWPKAYGGRGASFIEQAIYQEEMARAGTPDLIGVLGVGLVGPTIIAIGTEEQRRRYLKRILSAEDVWCQGFSEPNAGSDLASLSTAAVRDGDDFIINGQKIWTSYAHVADFCLLLVRTDTKAPKHEGITCLLLDMKTPGIEVRPLKMMTGDSAFNEVFFTDCRVPESQVLGQVNAGWHAAITALMNERANLGAGLYARFTRRLDALISHVRTLERNGHTAAQDPLVRQKIAQMFLEIEIFRLNNNRALTNISKTGMPGPEGSIQKLFWSEFNQRMAQMAMQILGPAAQLGDFDDGRWAFNYLRSRGNTIEAGTSEVQRNIVAQRVLGLPKSY